MNQASITYKPLNPEFTKKGFCHTQLCREGDFAIYHKYAEKNNIRQKEVDCGFEVVVIKRHNGYVIGGVPIEPAEVYPCTSQWGDFGWTYPDFLSAMRRFEKLVNGEFKVVDGEVVDEDIIESQDESEPETESNQESESKPHRGRPRKEQPPIKFPDGEFTMQELADFNGMPKPNVYLLAKPSIVEVRRESRGKGRPTVIYKKA